MELTGAQREELCEALLKSFLERIELRKMLSFKFNLELNDITNDDDNLADTIFKLVRWFETQSDIDQFIIRACLENSSNRDLQMLGYELRLITGPQEPATLPQKAEGARGVNFNPPPPAPPLMPAFIKLQIADAQTARFSALPADKRCNYLAFS